MTEKTSYSINVTNFCIIYYVQFFTQFIVLIDRRESKIAETCCYTKIENNSCVRRTESVSFFNKYLPFIKLQTKFIDRDGIKVFFFLIIIRPSVFWDVRWRMMMVAYQLHLHPRITKASITEQRKPEISHNTFL